MPIKHAKYNVSRFNKFHLKFMSLIITIFFVFWQVNVEIFNDQYNAKFFDLLNPCKVISFCKNQIVEQESIDPLEKKLDYDINFNQITKHYCFIVIDYTGSTEPEQQQTTRENIIEAITQCLDQDYNGLPPKLSFTQSVATLLIAKFIGSINSEKKDEWYICLARYFTNTKGLEIDLLKENPGITHKEADPHWHLIQGPKEVEILNQLNDPSRLSKTNGTEKTDFAAIFKSIREHFENNTNFKTEKCAINIIILSDLMHDYKYSSRTDIKREIEKLKKLKSLNTLQIFQLETKSNQKANTTNTDEINLDTLVQTSFTNNFTNFKKLKESNLMDYNDIDLDFYHFINSYMNDSLDVIKLISPSKFRNNNKSIARRIQFTADNFISPNEILFSIEKESHLMANCAELNFEIYSDSNSHLENGFMSLCETKSSIKHISDDDYFYFNLYSSSDLRSSNLFLDVSIPNLNVYKRFKLIIQEMIPVPQAKIIIFLLYVLLFTSYSFLILNLLKIIYKYLFISKLKFITIILIYFVLMILYSVFNINYDISINSPFLLSCLFILLTIQGIRLFYLDTIKNTLP